VGVVGTTALGQIEYGSEVYPAGVSATGQVGTVTATGIIFDFDAFKEQYSRRRTIYIARAA
jgi:hypothetical protein